MRKQFLALQILVLSFAINATAGGTTNLCDQTDKVIVSAPMYVYLPDGNTKQTVGEASIVSKNMKCNSSEHESIYIQVKLDDEIKPYGIKIKDSITAFENSISIRFRLKELVNSTDLFYISTYAKTVVSPLGSKQYLSIDIKEPSVLFWNNTKSAMGDMISAELNKQESTPLACSLDSAFVTLAKKITGPNGDDMNLKLTAIFDGPFQLCP